MYYVFKIKQQTQFKEITYQPVLQGYLLAPVG